jgi:hypothetical protein
MSPSISIYAGKKEKPSVKPDLLKVDNRKALEKWSERHGTKPKNNLGALSAASTFSSMQQKSLHAENQTQAQKFNAGLLYSYTWDEDYPPYGVYSFEASDPVSFSKLYVRYDSPANGGAFFANDKYYFTSYVMDDWGWDYSVTTYVVNCSTWKLETSYDQTLYHMASDLAYDPIKKVAYGCFYGGEDVYVWGYMDPANECGVTQIAVLGGELVAVAINSVGEAYGITNSGTLVKINKETGELTSIGYTGITPAYMQTATFDENNTLYWAAGFTDGSTGLFTVDLTNGHVTRVVAFQNDEEVIALYPEPAPVAEGAPAEASNLSLSFEGANLTGSLSFDVSNLNNLGETMTESVNYVVTLDGVEKYTGVANTGSNTVAVSVNNAGNHSFGVKLSNSKGECKAVYILKWIGIGRPYAVTDLSMTKTGDMQATLKWTAPTASLDSNYFDASRLSYTIIRMPENVTVANNVKDTQYVDNMEFEGQAYISYKVVPYADDVAGEQATSNGIVFGSAFIPPVTFDLDSEDNFNLFTIIDNNETPALDSGCWQYSPSAGCVGYNTGSVDGDDWFITPDIRLEAGRIYLFSYDVLCYSDYWPDKYAVYMGQGTTIEAMKTNLLEPTTIYWEDYRRPVIKVTVENDGIYNFGFHALSEAGGAFFLIDNISVTPSYKLKAPAASTEMTVKAGEKGALNATVSFKAPTMAVDSTELTSISEIQILRGETVVKTFSEVEPGKAYSFTEDNLEQGMAEYQVVAYNSYGSGVEVSASAWVGIDTPVEPEVSMNIVNGHPHITWTAPSEIGANGGYVDTAALKYIIYRPSDDKVLAQDFAGFEYTDEETTIPETGSQAIYQYGVFAQSTTGIGDAGVGFVISGEKYSMPFNESFAYGTTSKLWVRSSTSDDYWVIDDGWNGTPQDGDEGELILTPSTPGSEATIFSGKIDMTQAHNPTLSFYIKPMSYDDNGFAETSAEDDRIDIEIASTDFKFKMVKSIRPVDFETGIYTRVEVPLDEYAGKDFVLISFHAINGGARSPLCIDNISLVNTYDDNLKLKDFSLPTTVDVLSSCQATVTVYNDGRNAAEGYKVNLYKGDTLVGSETATEPLTYLSSNTFTFDLTVSSDWNEVETFTAEVVAAKDENADDNKATCNLTVIRPEMPEVTDFTGTVDTSNNFNFTWSAPNLEENLNVVEDFESYTHGSYKTVGNWTMIDEDGVFGFDDFKVGDDYIDIPHSLNKVAWMVINPTTAGVNIEANPGWAPHSGKQMLVSFCNWELDNDDWAVTPQLSGNAQTVSFWAKSGKADSGDVIYVYYSKDGVDIDDFIRVEKVNLTDQWTKYEYELPKGAKYFAVRYYKYNGYAVLMDDFSFEKAPSGGGFDLQILGYNIYCNGEKVNDELITTTSYTLQEGKAGTYAVSVVYNAGESKISNTIYLESSFVNNIYVEEDNKYPTYDLQGRRVNHLENGNIYIRNGRKFVFKKN